MTKFCEVSELHDEIQSQISVLLLDIEGTTTPITFVTETLFPYVRENLESYLTHNWEEEQTKNDVTELAKQSKVDVENGVEGIKEIGNEDKKEKIKLVIKNVTFQMDQDRKISALKQLQGHIWKNGYESGKLKSIVYSDVVKAIRMLKDLSIDTYIYSSGSVQAQKLLFKYSDQGDLTPDISGYFDTKIGNKKESKSYTSIAEEIGCKPNKILFLTDVLEEAAAASKAGVNACIVLRPGNKPIAEDELLNFTTIKSFSSLVKTKQQKTEK